MLSHLHKTKKYPHAILFVESKLCDLDSTIKQYKNMVGVSDGGCYIEISGYANPIKKEEITNIINQFQLSSYGNSAKLYVIKSIENTSIQAINALLKFLEEPLDNTYAILTTRNLNGVIATIKSRCQIFILKSNAQSIDQLVNKYNLTNQQIDIIKNVYYDLSSLTNDLENGDFFNYYNFATNLLNNYQDLITIKNLSEQFKKLSHSQIQMILKFINHLKPSMDLLQLIDAIKLTPSRLMIYNRL
jgi:DNA polymerase-3 subunit delta'